jgi:hypothetical protein
MEEENRVYLKCNYSKGMFSDEYFVNFKGSEYPYSDLGGVFVMKRNVVPEDESSGLVKAVVVRRDEFTSQILVPSVTESGTFFKVQNEEIVFEKN